MVTKKIIRGYAKLHYEINALSLKDTIANE